MSDLDGKAFILTGSGSGIGRAAALIAAGRGARLLVADLNEAAAHETVDLVRQGGGAAEAIRTDIGSEVDVEAMVSRAMALYGRLDGAFNNAAVTYDATPIHDMPLHQWQRNINITLTGTFLCVKHEARAMLPARRGAIVNTSSAAGLSGVKLGSEYSAAKHGVIGLTRSAALEYAGHGIRVNAIAPGAIRTPMLLKTFDADPALEAYVASTSPLGRLGEPHEMGEAAVWLLSDASSYVTGSVLVADGGYMA